MYVRALKGKRLELSTPNLVHIYSIILARHALTQKSKGQRSRSHCYKNRHGRTVASDACCYCPVPLLPACVCMSIRLSMFSSLSYFTERCILLTYAKLGHAKLHMYLAKIEWIAYVPWAIRIYPLAILWS